MDEILDITMLVAGVYERLGVPYLVGGSLASSLHGIPRATQDVDIVAEMKDSHVPAFVAALRRTFYLDEDAIRAAIGQRASLNVVHLGSYFKADIFIPKDDEASRLEMERRQRFSLGGDPPRDLIVASAEDVPRAKAVLVHTRRSRLAHCYGEGSAIRRSAIGAAIGERYRSGRPAGDRLRLSALLSHKVNARRGAHG